MQMTKQNAVEQKKSPSILNETISEVEKAPVEKMKSSSILKKTISKKAQVEQKESKKTISKVKKDPVEQKASKKAIFIITKVKKAPVEQKESKKTISKVEEAPNPDVEQKLLILKEAINNVRIPSMFDEAISRVRIVDGNSEGTSPDQPDKSTPQTAVNKEPSNGKIPIALTGDFKHISIQMSRYVSNL